MGLLFPSGINIFLDGYVPTENLRFRETSLVFKVAETAIEEEVRKLCRYQYPKMKKTMGDFTLEVMEGEFTDSEIVVMLGENGNGCFCLCVCVAVSHIITKTLDFLLI